MLVWLFYIPGHQKNKINKNKPLTCFLTYRLVSPQVFYFPLTLFIKDHLFEGKTRHLWGKDATRGLKLESHLSNYKYRRKKYFHYAREWGGAELDELPWQAVPWGKSKLKIP